MNAGKMITNPEGVAQAVMRGTTADIRAPRRKALLAGRKKS